MSKEKTIKEILEKGISSKEEAEIVWNACKEKQEEYKQLLFVWGEWAKKGL